MIDELIFKLRYRRLIVALAPVVVGALIGVVMVVAPVFTRILSIQKTKESLAKNGLVYGHIVELEKRLSVYKERLSAADNKTKTIEELSQYATQAGLNVFSITPEEKKATGQFLESISVRMEAEGNYHQLGEFVSRVENMSQFVKIFICCLELNIMLENLLLILLLCFKL